MRDINRDYELIRKIEDSKLRTKALLGLLDCAVDEVNRLRRQFQAGSELVHFILDTGLGLAWTNGEIEDAKMLIRRFQEKVE